MDLHKLPPGEGQSLPKITRHTAASSRRQAKACLRFLGVHATSRLRSHYTCSPGRIKMPLASIGCPMPIAYEIEHGQRLVTATPHGVLVDADIFRYQQEVWSR